MNKVFIDSDIILDMVIEREPFREPATRVFDLALEKEVELYTTPVVLSNVFYFSCKKYGPAKSKEHIKDVCLAVKILVIDKKTVSAALDSNFKDFEDALQYFAVKEAGVSMILTRNLKDYKVADLKVQTAQEYIEELLD
jgi:predicted nucleic acid-binding protein